jgi:hypothetical protein
MDFKAAILDAMAEVLRPLGFRKKGSHFTRESGGVVHLVSLQSSATSSADAVRVTVNLGVWVSALEGDAKPDIWAAHWRERLGFVMEERRDVWWDAASDNQAKSAAAAIADSIRRFALPVLETLASPGALLSLWKSGRSPGLTAVQAERLLTRLEAIEGAG